MRVPLLYPSTVVISPLDIDATYAVDPGTGAAAPQGYDPDLHEPIPYTSGTNEKELTTQYGPQLRIPCQVETRSFEELRLTFGGDATVSTMVFVLHNQDLVQRGLMNASGGGLVLKKNDRIDVVERAGAPGVVTQELTEPLFIYQIIPRSWGMGPMGQDLQLVYSTARPSSTQ